MHRALALTTVVLALAAAATPELATAATTSLSTVDLELADGRRTLVERSGRFTLVGLNWQGSGKVMFRTRSTDGRWTRWRAAAPEDEDGPDVGTREGRKSSGWRVGNPWWVGPSNRLEIERIGRVGRVQAHLVWSPAIGVPLRAPSMRTATSMPAIVSRLAWGANESIRRAPPSYAPSVRFAIVHHTAGKNAYTREEASAIVRGIQLFHVRGNGWNDIGYNYLVDRFGTVYEGRYGGIDKNVVGAHARGFNTGSAGIALLGTYGGGAPTRPAQDALAALVSWRLDLAHVDPTARLTMLSGGSERFAANAPVLLRAVSGHRDTGLTECPGDVLYGRLDGLAATAARLGGPKIFEPRVDTEGEGLVRLRARLSRSLPWNVVIERGGMEVARGSGSGQIVDWTWDAAGAETASYTWSISAGSARPAAGTIRAGLDTTELAVSEATASPTGITPNGDGQADSATLEFTLSRPANVTVEVVSGDGLALATVVDRVWTSAGQQTATVTGDGLPDGTYEIVVRARTAASSEVVQSVPLIVSRTLGLVLVGPEVFSPNGDGRRDRAFVEFTTTAPATATVRILRAGRWVATPLVGQAVAPGVQRVVWDGARSDGQLSDGELEARVEVTDGNGTVAYAVPFSSDTTPPRPRLLSGRSLRIAVDEPALLKVWVNGTQVKREARRAGIVLVRWNERVRRVRVVAWDTAGNVSNAVVWRPVGEGRGQ
jgi:hypothetical protein